MITMAYNVGDYGTIKVNKILQEIYNPFNSNKKEYIHFDKLFRVGDKVMNVKNNYTATEIRLNIPFDNDLFDENYIDINNIDDKDIESHIDNQFSSVYNGNIGMIKYITKSYVIVEIADKMIAYSMESLNNLELGYAINNFKCQGSESEYVISFVPSSHAFMLNRNLLYVALTRGKKRVICIGSPKALNTSLHKSAQFMRKTNLQIIVNAYHERISQLNQKG
jgi:exodeoxyribonuclease V alpha subunit